MGVANAFSSTHSQSLPMSDLATQLNSDPSVQFSQAEMTAALDRMQEANDVMVSEGVVYLI